MHTNFLFITFVMYCVCFVLLLFHSADPDSVDSDGHLGSGEECAEKGMRRMKRSPTTTHSICRERRC